MRTSVQQNYLMPVFYVLAFLVLLQSLLSLRGGVRFLRFIRQQTNRKRSLYMPLASVIVPCRGIDQRLSANLSALFEQHYPQYEIIFVSDSEDDPALAVAEFVRAESGSGGVCRTRFVFAGRADESGQKVHNLLAAVRESDPASDILVFVDTDAQPASNWLRNLISPLEDETVGAATGYRWFFPARGGLASHLRSVWNASIASALGPDTGRNFCWGGSTAVRRETFERLGMLERWRGTVSDDYALTRALKEAKLSIQFVPACLVASVEDCTFKELFEFTTRQIKITRVYAPHLWRIVLFSNLLFVMVFFGGIVLATARGALGLSWHWPAAIVCSIFLLGAWKAFFRLRAVALVLEDYHFDLREGLWPHLFLWPLTGALFFYNALVAAFSRRINWRGIIYELKSPNETDIIAFDAKEDVADAPIKRR